MTAIWHYSKTCLKQPLKNRHNKEGFTVLPFMCKCNPAVHSIHLCLLVQYCHPVLVPSGPRGEKTCLQWFANNKGADLPAHPCSLISPFVIRFSESIICELATGKNSIFWLVGIAEETGYETCFVGDPEDRFSRIEAHIMFACNPVQVPYMCDCSPVLVP